MTWGRIGRNRSADPNIFTKNIIEVVEITLNIYVRLSILFTGLFVSVIILQRLTDLCDAFNDILFSFAGSHANICASVKAINYMHSMKTCSIFCVQTSTYLVTTYCRCYYFYHYFCNYHCPCCYCKTLQSPLLPSPTITTTTATITTTVKPVYNDHLMGYPRAT